MIFFFCFSSDSFSLKYIKRNVQEAVQRYIFKQIKQIVITSKLLSWKEFFYIPKVLEWFDSFLQRSYRSRLLSTLIDCITRIFRGPRWQSGNTLASHLWGWGSIPVMASSEKAGSCLPLVGSLQYRTLANLMYWFPLPFQLPVVIWPVQCWKRRKTPNK